MQVEEGLAVAPEDVYYVSANSYGEQKLDVLKIEGIKNIYSNGIEDCTDSCLQFLDKIQNKHKIEAECEGVEIFFVYSTDFDIYNIKLLRERNLLNWKLFQTGKYHYIYPKNIKELRN